LAKDSWEEGCQVRVLVCRQIEDSIFFDDNGICQQARNVKSKVVVVSYAEKKKKFINNLYHSKEIDIVGAGLDRNYFFL
jgi:hypothetical protein